MAEVTKVAKAELKLLLEALGHDFFKAPFRRSSGQRVAYSIECRSCGQEWVLRFSDLPRGGAGKLVAEFPKLGERCCKAQKVAGG